MIVGSGLGCSMRARGDGCGHLDEALLNALGRKLHVLGFGGRKPQPPDDEQCSRLDCQDDEYFAGKAPRRAHDAAFASMTRDQGGTRKRFHGV